MDIERFTEGIRYIEIAGGIKLEQERKRVYYDRLQAIPNNLWEAGVIEVVDTHQYATFPTIAEIGEACVPGMAEREELDKWTRRWTKIHTPWAMRLTALLIPALLQLPALSENGKGLQRAKITQSDWGNLYATIKAKQ